MVGCGVVVALLVLGAFVTCLSDHSSILWWIIVGGGIAAYSGWKLAHSDKTPGLYSLPKDVAQGRVMFYATILRCIAERMNVEESKGAARYAFHFFESTHGPGCLRCEAHYSCWAIQKTMKKKLDQDLREDERALQASQRTR